jgi:DNA-binding CsgD family transcriptional regulator
MAVDLWDDDSWHELAARAVQLARDAGSLTTLPMALSYRAGVHVHAGEFAAAARTISESEAIAAAIGTAPLRYTALLLQAWRGDEAAASTVIDGAVQEAIARGEGRALGLAGFATALLNNGLGNYRTALDAARDACSYQDPGFFGWSLVELIEAAVRTGAIGEATEAWALLDERTSCSGTKWALGIRARSMAMLSEADRAESLFQQAIEQLEASRAVAQLARTELLYGEWLRREHRRVDSRVHLRRAHKMFTTMGARAFTGRAHRELAATGETVRKRTVQPTGDPLTPQEAQIARLAGDGLTNPEIGAQLFISPHTVEWHLRKVFAKLGISSRRQLRSASLG